MKIVYFAPQGFDYASSQLTEGLWLLKKRGSLNPAYRVDDFLCTAKMVHHGAKLDDMPVISEEEAMCSVRDADIIIFSSGGDMKSIMPRLAECLAEKHLAKKMVFLDGHDSNQYLLDPSKIKLYLKRELRHPEAEYLAWPNVRGFTFGVYDFHVDSKRPLFKERDIDIAFVAFGGSSPLRKQCADILVEARDRKQFGNVFVSVAQDRQPLSIEEYTDIMLRSKIIINVTGAGIDTLRFWEAMGFGAVLCSVDIHRHLYIRNMPEPRRQAVYFDSWSRMLEVCESVVKNPSWWLSMRESADELIRCYHTTEARAKQMIQLCRELV